LIEYSTNPKGHLLQCIKLSEVKSAGVKVY